MSRAKAARAKEKARKINKASIREEQTLLARVGVYCDLALMGSSSWSNYHDQLKLGGQREAIVESLGGGVKSSVAAKAWKVATSSALGPKPITPPKPKRPQPLRKNGKLRCYWCHKFGHRGKFCEDKKAGRPCHPQSRQAGWDAEKATVIAFFLFIYFIKRYHLTISRPLLLRGCPIGTNGDPYRFLSSTHPWFSGSDRNYCEVRHLTSPFGIWWLRSILFRKQKTSGIVGF